MTRWSLISVLLGVAAIGLLIAAIVVASTCGSDMYTQMSVPVPTMVYRGCAHAVTLVHSSHHKPMISRGWPYKGTSVKTSDQDDAAAAGASLPSAGVFLEGQDTQDAIVVVPQRRSPTTIIRRPGWDPLQSFENCRLILDTNVTVLAHINDGLVSLHATDTVQQQQQESASSSSHETSPDNIHYINTRPVQVVNDAYIRVSRHGSLHAVDMHNMLVFDSIYDTSVVYWVTLWTDGSAARARVHEISLSNLRQSTPAATTLQVAGAPCISRGGTRVAFHVWIGDKLSLCVGNRGTYQARVIFAYPPSPRVSATPTRRQHHVPTVQFVHDHPDGPDRYVQTIHAFERVPRRIQVPVASSPSANSGLRCLGILPFTPDHPIVSLTMLPDCGGGMVVVDRFGGVGLVSSDRTDYWSPQRLDSCYHHREVQRFVAGTGPQDKKNGAVEDVREDPMAPGHVLATAVYRDNETGTVAVLVVHDRVARLVMVPSAMNRRVSCNMIVSLTRTQGRVDGMIDPATGNLHVDVLHETGTGGTLALVMPRTTVSYGSVMCPTRG